jgi:WD40 repeat protein
MHCTTFNTLLVVLPLFLQNAALSQETASSEVTWDQVKPVFQKRCFACHRGEQARGGLDVSTVAGIKAGSTSGAAVVSGKPEESMIYTLPAHLENPQMPPNSAKMPQRELDLIFGWIQGGLSERVTAATTATKSSRPTMNRPRPRMQTSAMRPKKTATDASAIADAVDAEDSNMTVVTASPSKPVRSLSRVVTAVAASPTASLVAVAGHREVFLYHWTDQSLVTTIPFPAGDVFVLRFSRDGSTLLVGGGIGGASGKVMGFDVATGAVLFEVGNESDVVLAADLSPDGRLVALSGPSRSVKLFDTVSGEKTAEMKKHTDWVLTLAFSNDGLLLASGDRFGSLQIWEATSGSAFHTLRGHSGAIHGVVWSPDSNTVMSVSEDGTLREWDMHEGKQLRIESENIGGLLAADSAAAGPFVVGARSGKLAIRKTPDQPSREITMDDEVTDLAMTQDATHVIAADVTGNVVMFNLETGNEAGQFHLP